MERTIRTKTGRRYKRGAGFRWTCLVAAVCFKVVVLAGLLHGRVGLRVAETHYCQAKERKLALSHEPRKWSDLNGESWATMQLERTVTEFVSES